VTKISAAENITTDFVWLPSAISFLSDLVSGFGPVLALFGAIYLYFRKEQADRIEARRQEKRSLYSRFLGEIGQVWNSFTDGRPKSPDTADLVVKLGFISNELNLLGGDGIHSCALNIRQHYQKMIAARWDYADQDNWVPITENEKAAQSVHIKELARLENKIIGLMKKDLADLAV